MSMTSTLHIRDLKVGDRIYENAHGTSFVTEITSDPECRPDGVTWVVDGRNYGGVCRFMRNDDYPQYAPKLSREPQHAAIMALDGIRKEITHETDA